MLISNAYAQAGGDPTGGLAGLLPIIVMFVIFWFLMIRPQMKRSKEQKALVAALAKGDEVVTHSGIVGKVTKVTDTYVTVEVTENVEITMLKQTVASILPKGTIKNI